MIDFNSKDFNLTQIRSESKMGNLITKFPYRIFGIKQNRNYLVKIGFNSNRLTLRGLGILSNVLRENGIELKTDFAYTDSEEIVIGLRRDIRKNVLFSSALLQTIIYCLEERLVLTRNTKLPKIPS